MLWISAGVLIALLSGCDLHSECAPNYQIISTGHDPSGIYEGLAGGFRLNTKTGEVCRFLYATNANRWGGVDIDCKRAGEER